MNILFYSICMDATVCPLTVLYSQSGLQRNSTAGEHEILFSTLTIN